MNLRFVERPKIRADDAGRDGGLHKGTGGPRSLSRVGRAAPHPPPLRGRNDPHRTKSRPPSDSACHSPRRRGASPSSQRPCSKNAAPRKGKTMQGYLLAGVSAGAIILGAGQSMAAEAPAAVVAAASSEIANVEEVVVYGRGESRQVQSLPVREIEQAAPGTSPIKMVEMLPGVNFQSADAFGTY